MDKKENIKNKNTTLPFIKTSDKNTMEILKMEGFELIDYNNGIWTFVNCIDKITKANFESNKLTYSNMLCI